MKSSKAQQKRVHVFIDASNLWEAQKAKRVMLDYGKLQIYLKNIFNIKELNIFYYTAYPAEGTRDYSLGGKHRFFTFLEKGLGFTVRKKKLKRIKIIENNLEKIQEKGNMDVEMAIDVVDLIDEYDVAIFFTGDADFLALVNYVRNNGKKVFVFSSEKNVSKELRGGSDGYIDILDIEEDIWGNQLRHNNNKR